MNVEVEGIVLKQVPYSEKNKMMTIITKSGLLSFSARGIASITSKNASSCNLFAFSSFSLSKNGENYSLKQGRIIDSHSELYSSLEMLSAIQVASEAILRFMDADNDRIYDYFISLIENLKKGFDSKTLLVIFLAQIIKDSGYGLEYSSCVKCGSKKEIIDVDYRFGGFVCKNCACKIEYTPWEIEYLNSFRYSFMVEAIMMDHYMMKSEITNRLLKEYIEYLKYNFELKEFKSFDIYKNSIM